MNSFISMKISSRRLLLISAATLITANSGIAANRVDQQSYPEPQEQARRLILGQPSFEGPASRKVAVRSKTIAAPPASERPKDGMHTDPQELARRMILGDSGKESAHVRLSTVR